MMRHRGRFQWGISETLAMWLRPEKTSNEQFLCYLRIGPNEIRTKVGIPRCRTTNALPKSPRHKRVLKKRSRAQKLVPACDEKLLMGHSVSLMTVKNVVFISSFGAGFVKSSTMPNAEMDPSSFNLGTLTLFRGNAIGFRLAASKRVKLGEFCN